MTVSPGTQLGIYEVLASIGAGGMGEVYRARDTKLGREVAIKVLPDTFAQNPERLARFKREAKLLASLNHTNIATIHGLEESGGTHYLVMEMVPGDTLAERIQHDGAVPIEEALGITTQIAEALEHAHEKGVIHRDLKPANVKVTPDGKVKVLDFGLAKAFAEPSASDVVDSQSPTLMTASPTMPGVILGTAAYMSPEQAKGKPIDKRTDIWAFGCVLYELLTGKQVFEGESASEILGAIHHKEPNWEVLPETTPPGTRAMLRRCLQKDAKRRLRDAGDLRIQIEDSMIAPAASVDAAVPARAVWQQPIFLVLAAVALVTIASITVWNLRTTPTLMPQPLSRMAMVLPPDQHLTFTGRHQVAFSPDGTHLVYVANEQLYLRPMDSLEAKPIPGTLNGGGRSPFFSPDGQWVGFWAGGNLKKVSINGGVPVILCDASNLYGASWGPDDRILFGQGRQDLEGIYQVSAAGGSKELLISLDTAKGELAHGPHLLPGGEAVLFTLSSGGPWNEAQIVVEQLETGERKVLINGGTDARYVPTGHLVYAQQGSLLAVPFDLERLEVTGNTVPVAEGVTQSGSDFTGAAHFSFSQLGSLVYVPGITGEETNNLIWVDREGQQESLAEDRIYDWPRFSPDGAHVALSVFDEPQDDVWIYDLERKMFTRLTFDPANDSRPIWTPDGLRVVFASNRDGAQDNLYWKAVDGTGQVERLTTSPNFQWPSSFSPDGKKLVFVGGVIDGSSLNLYVLSMVGEPAAQPLLRTQFNENNPAISPDGRWIAYDSNESGRNEIYVRPFPNVEEGKWQISSDGGEEPMWGRQGRELFYSSDEAMKVVSIRAEPTFTVGSPEILFAGISKRRYSGIGWREYDVSPDGQRFLMIGAKGVRLELIIVHNWFEELKRLVPVQ